MWADLIEMWSMGIAVLAVFAAMALCWRARRVRVDPGWRPTSSDQDVIFQARTAAIVEAGQRWRRLDTWTVIALLIAALATCVGCGAFLMQGS